MQDLAAWPKTSGWTGTSRKPRSSKPSFSTMISNIFLAWLRFSSFWGKNNWAMPYSRSSPKAIPSWEQIFLKNRWEIWSRMPTPSPVLPSASFPARCSRFSTILRAFSTVLWLFMPLLFTMAPIPQLSCSNCCRYRPWSSLLSRSFIMFSPLIFDSCCIRDAAKQKICICPAPP